MNTIDLRSALCAFINDAVSLDPGIVVDAATDLLLTGLVDSLGVVQIVSWMETELDITVEPTDVVLEHFQTVDAMATFVHRKGAALANQTSQAGGPS